jgi:mycofactocin glycosyltransferase
VPVPGPPQKAAAVLPSGFRVQLTARRHAGGLLESLLRPAIVRVHVPREMLPTDGRLRVDGPVDAALARRLLDLDLAVPEPVEEAACPGLDQLTVVIPVRDRAAAVDRLLSGLLTGTPVAGRPRVLVINDASLDTGTLATVTARHAVERLDLPVNVGPAGARNVGLSHVTTPFVALVDSDVTATAAQLARLLREFTDPLLAVAAPRVVAHRGTTGVITHPIAQYEHLAAPLDLGRRPGLVGPSRRLTYVPSACWVGRTEALVNGFSEDLRLGEDVDLVWRLTDAGWMVRYVPEVRVGHASRQDTGGWLRQHAGYGLSSAPLSRRHPARLAPARYNPTGWAVALSMAAPWPIFGATCTVAFGLSCLRLRRRLGRFPASGAVAARLAWSGLSANLIQTASLTSRYWFPLVMTWALFGQPARRLLVRALVVDALAVAHDRSPGGAPATGHASASTPLDVPEPTRYAIAFDTVRAAMTLLPGRVGENAAFAWGVLCGCLRYRTLAPLIPAAIWSAGPRRARRPLNRRRASQLRE